MPGVCFLGKKCSLKSYVAFWFPCPEIRLWLHLTHTFWCLKLSSRWGISQQGVGSWWFTAGAKGAVSLTLISMGLFEFFFLSRAQQYPTFFSPSFWQFFNGCNMAVSNEFIGQTHVTYPFLDSFVQSNSLFWLWLLKSPILDQWPSKSGSKIIPTRWAP